MFFLTALAVSIDAYLAGIAFIFENNKKTTRIVLSTGFYTLILCIIAFTFRIYLSNFAIVFKIIGFLIFLLLGIKNICEGFEKTKEEKRIEKVIKTHAIGIGVSTDAGLASLSIEITKSQIFYASAVMALFHAGLVLLGLYTSKYTKIAKDMQICAGIFLIVMGIMKLL